jgi:cytochrome P450
MNINAGSDIISTTLRAVFYYLLKTPSRPSKLRSELDKAVSEDSISPLFVPWTESQTLPYLCAVIKEALRLHPALSLPLERVVPPTGLLRSDASKTFLPPGTVVGMNAWVLHRDKRIFGPDADKWESGSLARRG